MTSAPLGFGPVTARNEKSLPAAIVQGVSIIRERVDAIEVVAENTRRDQTADAAADDTGILLAHTPRRLSRSCVVGDCFASVTARWR
jgi:hypothetical protein